MLSNIIIFIFIYSNNESIVKVITYIDGDENLKIVKTNKSNYDISTIDLKKFIGTNYIDTRTELLEILDEKYILSPSDKNTKYGYWINANVMEKINSKYDSSYKVFVTNIEYIDKENNKVVISSDAELTTNTEFSSDSDSE